MQLLKIKEHVEALFASPPTEYTSADWEAFAAFKQALNAGEIRAAEPDLSTKTGWRVNDWVKRGILLGFRMGSTIAMPEAREQQPFFDKSSYPPRKISAQDEVRLVPGGSSIRDGCFVGRGVICMPPMFINVGAWIGEGTMIDSHALVGSCAQVGRSCHISAGAQIGGVLEPAGAMPVIIEDEVLVGGNCGLYEGVVVKQSAVLGSGTILNRSIPVYDLVHDKTYMPAEDDPLVIPAGAVVVPGSRALTSPAAVKHGLSLQAAVIVKYRDARTDARIRMEDLLR